MNADDAGRSLWRKLVQASRHADHLGAEAEVRQAFRRSYDCTLFNCSAGKDRTGVLACLLLDLAGCHEYDIVKDYSESYENNMKMMKQLEEMLPKEEEKFLGSDPRVMMRFLAYLREQYGSSKGYLLNIGLDEDQIEEIKENFII